MTATNHPAAPAVVKPVTNHRNGIRCYPRPVGGYRFRPELSTSRVAVFVLPAPDYHRTLHILMYFRCDDGTLTLPVFATLNARECCELGSRQRVRCALINRHYNPGLQAA